MNHRSAAGPALPAALGCLVAFTLLAVEVAGHHGAPLLMDSALESWSVRHRPAMAVAVARGITSTGTGVIPYLLAALAGVVVGRGARQRVVSAVAALAFLGAVQLVRYGVMSALARPRPPMGDWAARASGWSFPSGHTTTSAATAGLLMAAVLLRAPRNKRVLATLIGCWAVLVGLSRVYLGVHWSTDVIGGWLFSVFWLSVGILLLVRFRPDIGRYGPRSRPPSAEPAEPAEPAGPAGPAGPAHLSDRSPRI
ncbi:phosphatase PAP2 family protein [Streptomyces sp. A 4/2]|uniref:phosphatase PAP2 family protein n=1 Tax=Streptomyces sp. A 4/2 TaxID=2934314 RepID=UPI002023E398|nr:phosphatase PAP2 family protein [Streptomyces sp. A 4/2]